MDGNRLRDEILALEAAERQPEADLREYAVELVKTYYADFGPTLATEALAERDAIYVVWETLRRWMMADGV